MSVMQQDRSIASRAPFSRVRSVSQILLTFESDDPEKMFREIQKEALQWLAKRAGRLLPKHAWTGDSFELLEAGAQPVSVIALDDPKYWCFRISDADRSVPRRSWVTESGILLDGNKALFGCRLQCVALGESPEFDATIPGIVMQVVSNHPAYLDGRRVSQKAWAIHSDDGVDSLVDLLENRVRTRPVIVVALGDDDGNDGYGIVNADEIARLTLGAAHVVTLTTDAAYALTDRVGKEFSVFRQAVRTYRPGFDSFEDSPTDHPVALPRNISEWPEGGGKGFQRFLIERALRDTVIGVDIYRALPSFAEIHAKSLSQKRARASQAGASERELLAIALEENDSLRRKLEDDKETYDGLLSSAEEDRRLVEAERDGARNEIRSLSARIMHLESALNESGRHEEVPIPESFEKLDEWCRSYLSGSVHVVPRALRMATKSEFEKPDLAYRTLLILRDNFIPMKREGGLEKKGAYERALAELGLEDSPSFAGSRAGEQGDEYKVNYNGRPRYLDRHIKGSNSRDERYGFRLYFFWDDDTRQVVVGSFPTHLATRAS